MKQIIWFASQNKQKIKEVKSILEPYGFKVKSLLDGYAEIDIIEDGDSYIANALIKAKALAKIVNAPTIGDDTGLEIETLNQFPGLVSNRWKANMTFYEAMQTIIKKMNNCKNRKAAMITAIAYVDPINHIEKTFIGQVNGEIVTDLGPDHRGFGYDQCFYVTNQQQTFYEMGTKIKNKISHRAIALNQLLDFLMQTTK